jgi:DNA-binding MarR family transcriptional regulator
MNKMPVSLGMEIFEVFRLLRREADTRMRGFGYTQGQWRVLAYLKRNEGISQVGLADMLDMQPISLARVLDRMEAAGLIERRPDPQDRRALKLFLLPAAEPMLDILRNVSEEVHRAATADLSAEEEATLKRLLDRMRRSVEKTSTIQSERPARPRANPGDVRTP